MRDRQRDRQRNRQRERDIRREIDRQAESVRSESGSPYVLSVPNLLLFFFFHNLPVIPFHIPFSSCPCFPSSISTSVDSLLPLITLILDGHQPTFLHSEEKGSNDKMNHSSNPRNSDRNYSMSNNENSNIDCAKDEKSRNNTNGFVNIDNSRNNDNNGSGRINSRNESYRDKDNHHLMNHIQGTSAAAASSFPSSSSSSSSSASSTSSIYSTSSNNANQMDLGSSIPDNIEDAVEQLLQVRDRGRIDTYYCSTYSFRIPLYHPASCLVLRCLVVSFLFFCCLSSPFPPSFSMDFMLAYDLPLCCFQLPYHSFSHFSI